MRKWAIINKNTSIVVTVLGWESDLVTQKEMEETTTILKDDERIAVIETDSR